ncbi:hypothetical protein GGR74_001852 [Xanthomonas arboricola]
MQWLDSLFDVPFLSWLRRISTSGRYTQQVPSDPFATSMRNLDDVADALAAVKKGIPINAQRATDLRAAQLVDDGRLTPLGENVLDGWVAASVDNQIFTDELPRQLILVCESLIEGNAFYQGVVAFWRERFERYGASNIIEKWESSYVISFFANAYGGTYSPLKAYEKSSAVLPEWDGRVIRSRVASEVGPDDAALAGLDRIISAIDGWKSRGKARKIFLIAVDLALAPDALSASTRLATWKLPQSSSGRSYDEIPEATRIACLSILERYRSRLGSSSLGPTHLDLLHKRKNVVLYGPPGTGKTYAATKLADYWRARYGEESVITLTFHPSYSYEDFVWGWRPDEASTAGFSPRKGALLEACEIAADATPVLLLIDEINRADTARVFGELITYIESDKRDLPFRIAQDPTRCRTIPSSLHILGTMNTADRSVSLMDVALRRRFAFVEFEPDGEALSLGNGWISEVSGIHLGEVLAALNSRLAAAGVEPDRAVGHALLAISTGADEPEKELKDRFRFDIYPLIADYCFADRSRIAQVLGSLVSKDGKFKIMTNADFISALGELLQYHRNGYLGSRSKLEKRSVHETVPPYGA